MPSSVVICLSSGLSQREKAQSSLALHAGKLAAPELATMDARRARDLTDPPTAVTASQPGSQQDNDGTPAGVFHADSSHAQVRTERAIFDSNP